MGLGGGEEEGEGGHALVAAAWVYGDWRRRGALCVKARGLTKIAEGTLMCHTHGNL